jgi:hypothetical protein
VSEIVKFNIRIPVVADSSFPQVRASRLTHLDNLQPLAISFTHLFMQ